MNQTLENVREKYEKAKGKKLDAEGLVGALKEEVERLKEEILTDEEFANQFKSVQLRTTILRHSIR